MKNIILIPARGGSKNISRQNLRLVNNKPLLYYVIKTALLSKNTDIFVTTESEEIEEFSLDMGVNVIKRPKSLATSTTNFEEIAQHAIEFLKKNGKNYEKCLILNPLMPLIESKTIKKFFSCLHKPRSYVMGYEELSDNQRKLSSKNTLPKLEKINENIVNLKKIIGFFCNDFLNIDDAIPVFGIKLNSTESITIHNYHDLEIVSKILKRRKILVRVDGSKTIGLGHVYNMLTILNHFHDDEILVVMNSKKDLGENKFRMQNYKLKKFSNQNQLNEIIKKFHPDIVINDILNTKKQYIQNLKREYYVINFEDLGSGSDYADLVFNPIYESKTKNSNKFFGSEYACVRDEFRILKNKPIKKIPKKILITFGGTDPYNITYKILNYIQKLQLKQYDIMVILGIGNSNLRNIQNIKLKMQKIGYDIEIITDSNLMAKHIRDSDFVISGNGRTVFEIASLYVPMITISANEREESHKFSKLTGGAIHLGDYSKLNINIFEKAIKKIIKYENRFKFSNNLKKHNMLNGVNKIITEINHSYEKYSIQNF